MGMIINWKNYSNNYNNECSAPNIRSFFTFFRGGQICNRYFAFLSLFLM